MSPSQRSGIRKCEGEGITQTICYLCIFNNYDLKLITHDTLLCELYRQPCCNCLLLKVIYNTDKIETYL